MGVAAVVRVGVAGCKKKETGQSAMKKYAGHLLFFLVGACEFTWVTREILDGVCRRFAWL